MTNLTLKVKVTVTRVSNSSETLGCSSVKGKVPIKKLKQKFFKLKANSRSRSPVFEIFQDNLMINTQLMFKEKFLIIQF